MLEAKKNYLQVFIFCLLVSFFFILLATKSSPLYPFNDWVDANISFTMGKGMINGKVLYRDLFDHKGPLFYFLFGLAYLISNTTFLGVFIFEVISFSVFLFFSYKIITLFLNSEYALIALPIMACSILNLNSFVHGGSLEEFCLPLVAISLYHLFAYHEGIYPKSMPHKWVFINGVIVGCVLWMKFSLLGFWLGWIVSIFVVQMINKKVISAIKTGMVFLSGVGAATLPWLLYFGINHSIYEWINSYILINVKAYSDYSEATVLIPNLRFIPIKFIGHLLLNPVIVGHLYLGLITFLTSQKFIPGFIKKFSLMLSFLLLSISVFGFGKSYTYYFLIFAPFIVFGFIVVLQFAEEKFGQIKSRKKTIVILSLFLISAFFYTSLFHHNAYMLKVDKKDLVQFRFASIINQREDASLLNYGALDSGFYTTTGITPNVRFFQMQNIASSRFSLPLEEQNRYIKDRLVDFVVVINSVSEDNEIVEIPGLMENYVLIESETQRYEGEEINYSLYKLR